MKGNGWQIQLQIEDYFRKKQISFFIIVKSQINPVLNSNFIVHHSIQKQRQISYSNEWWFIQAVLFIQSTLDRRYYTYFFLLITKRKMSISFSLSEHLTNIQKSLNLKANSQNDENLHQKIQKMKEQLFNCENTYYGGVQRKILITKIKIDDSIERMKSEGKEMSISNTQKNILKALQTRLNGLNSDIDHLLKEGILTLYMDLCDLKERIAKLHIIKLIDTLIKDIIQTLTNLLKSFFIYQEYHHSKNTHQTKKNILSLRNLNPIRKQVQQNKPEFDEKVMKQIQQSLSKKPVSQLLDAYMSQQQKQINETLQVCRICSFQIKLENMQKHVRLCQKKSLLKQQIQQKKALINKLLDDLKNQYHHINEKQERTQEQQSFRRIAKLLLCSQKQKERNVIRRSSLVAYKSQKSFKDKLQQRIEEYQQQNGQHYILHKILQACRQKGYLEKKINTIQINALNSDQNDSQSFVDRPNNHHSIYQQHKIAQVNLDNRHQPKLKNCASFQEQKGSKSSLVLNPTENQKSLPSNSSNLSSNNFRSIISTKRSLKKNSKQIQYQQLYKHYVSLQDITLQQEQKLSISLQNFQILKFLGQGAFGKVYLARRIETADVYALKIIKVNENYQEKELQAIKNQHQIFKKIAGDHLVKAPFSFSEKQSHMFVLQYMPGGDLRKMLDDEVYFQQDKAKFYIAEIVLAIEHLHKFQIIHRDLKPQNLVIDKEGHLKLTDFGLSEFQIKVKLEKSKRLSQQAKNIRRRRMRRSAGIWGNKNNGKLIGTPDYIAPEIISQMSINNFTIDWWSLGVMMYQMLIGARPFCAETIEEVIQNITQYKIEWPQIGYEQGMISPQAKDLISQLLNVDFVNRLGSNGTQQIKSHPFFTGIDWTNLKKSKPPMIPKINKISDYFEMKEDKQLREQIDKIVGSSNKQNKRLKLDRFVRFDLLGDQTIENAEKIYEQKTNRIQKLKTLRKLEIQATDEKQTKEEQSCT